MCKISSYLKIEELVNIAVKKGVQKAVGLLNVCTLVSLLAGCPRTGLKGETLCLL